MSQNARYDEEQSTLRRARVLNLEYFDTSASYPKTLYKDILSSDKIKALKAVPLSADQSHILFGILTTTPPQTMHFLVNAHQDQLVNFAIISETGFREYDLLYNPPPQVVYKEIAINNTESNNLVDDISKILDQVRADDMLAYLVQQAHRLNASDIHIETKKSNALIRYRIDGVLHPIAKLNIDKYRILISAIASAGNISTSSAEAQQGHIAQKVTMADGSQVDVNLRIETVQTVNAMDVVMRLFNLDQDMFNLDRLGLSENERNVVDDIISKPSGLVMVVGPTGSGKTTTLYSIMNALASDERKIITIEDPVEYQFDNITQIPVKLNENDKDDNFADKLKAVLRLDPDIVMVGEIRDSDTARTALQAALTGHLVLTTFHASSAAAALTRLTDVIGQNPLFVSAIRLVMAQRLVRKLDDSIKVEDQLTDAQKAKVQTVIDSMPENIAKPDINSTKFYSAGHSDQNPFGFNGQLAIREQLTMTPTLKALLESSNKNITTQDIEEAAVKDGMRTMLQDAILKVIAGETSIEEIYRVVG